MPVPRKNFLYLTTALLLTAIVFSSSLRNGWSGYDDHIYIENNPLIRDISAAGLLEMVKTTEVNGSYSPLSLYTFGLNYRLGKLDPGAYHLTNCILHLANTGLCFWFILLLTGSRQGAFFISMIFGIHPMHVEAVAWISSRKDLLFTFFTLAGLILYLRLPGKLGQRAVWTGIAIFILYFLSLNSKSTAISFPVVLIGLELFRGEKLSGKKLLLILPLVFMSVIYGGIAIAAQREGLGMESVSDQDIFMNLIFAIISISHYILSFFIPALLSVVHPFPTGTEDLTWFQYSALVFLAAFIYLIFRYARKDRKILASLLIFIVTISPALQIMRFGISMIGERFTYLPYIGLALALYFPVEKFNKNGLSPVRSKTIALAASAFILILSVLSFQRFETWRNGETLWTDVIDKYPDFYYSYACRGNFYFEKEMDAAALADFGNALKLNPGFAESHNNRALIYIRQGNLSLALSDLDRAIALDPEFPGGWNNRGQIHMNQKDYMKAVEDFTSSIFLNASQGQVWHDRGICYLEMGLSRQALGDLEEAVRINPENPNFRFDLGQIYKYDTTLPPPHATRHPQNRPRKTTLPRP